MAKKIEVGTREHKLAVLELLWDNGVSDEKELAALDVSTMLCIDGLSIDDLKVMIELQKQVKAGKLFSYLGGGNPKEKRGDAQ